MMICEQIREKIPDLLAGRLDAAARSRVIDHLETCSACRADVAELGVVWRGLEAMSEPEPSQAMRTRFRETLAAYEEGFQDAQRRQALAMPVRTWWSAWWPSRPAFQMAFAGVLAAICLIGGRYLGVRGETPNPEIAQLRGQVESLRQMVALSLLREQSPSARLRGAAYSYQVAQPDEQVEQALLHAVNHDPNVNVRLSAVDALAKLAGRPDVRRALADAISVQDSPLVEVALIDLLVQAGDRDALPSLRKVAEDKEVDPAVRQRAVAGIGKLGVAK